MIARVPGADEGLGQRVLAYLAARYQLHRHYVREIAKRTGLPLVCLPLIATGIRGPDEIAALAEPLLGRPTEPSP